MSTPKRYRDPKSTAIEDWKWLPLSKVRDKVGLTEIPSHVEKFGDFMNETARRAMEHGLTPRDLIKAYTITRFSIQRTARKKEKIKDGGLWLPDSVKPGTVIRPEGAFGHWLHTKHGQKYLDDAEAGRINEEAIADAQDKLRTFGKVDEDLPDALRWAPKNLPGQEGRISELVGRAMRGQSDPSEWREETKGLKGIRSAKAGFYAANLGRGDQPTWDARQIVEHTGRPSKEASAYNARQGGLGATEAVQRLAARQGAMDLPLQNELQPHYQHLVHHAFWDKSAGEQTTHQDMMDAMRTAASGGRIERARGGRTDDDITSHPLFQALARAGLPGYGHILKDVPQGPLKRALKEIHSPHSDDPEEVKAALRIADSLRVPTKRGDARLQTHTPYYNINQPAWPEDVVSRVSDLPGTTMKKRRDMTWEDLHREGKGGHIINLGGDRSRAGTLTSIMGKDLAWPVNLYAGPGYMREYNPGSVWASAAPQSSGLLKLTKQLSKGDKPVYGVYAPMGAQSADSAHHMFDALMAQIPGSGIDTDKAAEFDTLIKAGMHMDPAKRPRAIEKMAKWPGILNAKEASDYARTLPGAHRAAIVKMMDKTPWLKAGFPAVGMTRVAITDPAVMNAPGNMIGHRVVRLDPDKVAHEKTPHTTYTAPSAGEYVGDVPLVQRQYATPDATVANLTKKIAGDRVVHPYSSDNFGRGTARDMYDKTKVAQQLTPEQLDNVQQGLERQDKYKLWPGMAAGGRVGYDAGGCVPGTSVNAPPTSPPPPMMPGGLNNLVSGGGSMGPPSSMTQSGLNNFVSGGGSMGPPPMTQGSGKGAGGAGGLDLNNFLSGGGSMGGQGTMQSGGGQAASSIGSFAGPFQQALLRLGAFRASGGRVGRADGGPVDPPTDQLQMPPTPSYIKPIDEDRRQLSPVGLYSHAAEAAWKQPQMKMAPDQWKATLANKHGVKPDEFKWSGFDQAFAGKKSATKREVRDHFVRNMPKVHETVKHAEPIVQPYVPDEPVDDGEDETRHGEHQLPGGRNYREVLLHLPKVEHPDLPALREAHKEALKRRGEAAQEKVRAAAAANEIVKRQAGDEEYDAATKRTVMAHKAYEATKDHLADIGDRIKALNTGNNYHSSHWDEPNVLAHLRMSDRDGPPVPKYIWRNKTSGATTRAFASEDEARRHLATLPEKLHDNLKLETMKQHQKVLHLEELQSDWGQAAREKGIGGPTAEEKAEMEALFRHPSLTPEQHARYDELNAKRNNPIPPAPYIDTTAKWTDLGLKRALHEAAKGGYDRLVVTPGDEQNKRYSLSKHVDKVNLLPDPSGQHRIEGYKDNHKVLEHYAKDEQGIAAAVGKEVAEKLLASRNQHGAATLAGQDLEVGGAGMKGYYDKILPTALEKLARQHDPAARVHLHAQPIKISGTRAPPGEYQDMLDHHDISEELWRTLSRPQQNQMYQEFRAQTGVKDHVQAHALDITPAMRASILHGHRAFAAGGRVADRITDRVYQRVRKVIDTAGRYPGSSTP